MPTVTTVECPSCGDMLGAKDFLPKQGATCPRCGAQVEFVVLQRARQAARAAASAEKIVPDEPPTPEPVEAPPEEAPPLPLAAALPGLPSGLDDGADGTLKRIGLGALVAFAAGCLGLLVASLPWVGFLSKPLSLIGLLVGIGAALAQPQSGKGGYSVTAAMFCVLILILVGEWPRWRSRTPPIPLDNVVIPLRGGGTLPTRPLDEEEWVNAAENAIRRADIRVQIVSATLGLVDLKQGPQKLAAPSKAKHLILQVAIVCEGPRAPQLQYEPWADLVMSPSTFPAGLTDEKGRKLIQDTFDAKLTVVGRGEKKRFQTGSQIREVLVFAVPPADAQSLRLELPAGAYQLDGAFRFQIPRSMLVGAAGGPPQTGGKPP
jgi:hypothetical protein